MLYIICTIFTRIWILFAALLTCTLGVEEERDLTVAPSHTCRIITLQYLHNVYYLHIYLHNVNYLHMYIDLHINIYNYLHNLTLWPPTPPVLHSVRLPAATRRSQLPGLGSEARTKVWRYTVDKYQILCAEFPELRRRNM